MKLTLFSLSLFLLSGCATLIQAPPDLHAETRYKVSKKTLSRLQHFEVIGKMGFNDGQQGGHARILWEQHPQSYQIRLYGPLGSGAVQIKGEPNQITLTKTDGKTISAKTPESLIYQEWGWIIPVSGLRYWLKGLPAPGAAPTKMLLDTNQRLWRIEQQGWTIVYEAYQTKEGLDLPYKLLLRNGNIRLKFIFDRWNVK